MFYLNSRKSVIKRKIITVTRQMNVNYGVLSHTQINVVVFSPFAFADCHTKCLRRLRGKYVLNCN